MIPKATRTSARELGNPFHARPHSATNGGRSGACCGIGHYGTGDQRAAEAVVRQRRRLHPRDPARGRGLPESGAPPRDSRRSSTRRPSSRSRSGLHRGSRSSSSGRASCSDAARSPASILGTVLIAFCVQHDANHGAYFGIAPLQPPDGLDRRRDARLLELRVARQAQRRAPHVHERRRLRRRHQPGAVRAAPAGAGASKPWYRLQHIYIWPLYSLMVLRWQTFGDIAALMRGRIGRSKLRMPRGWDLAGLVGGKLIFVSWAIVDPAARLPLVGRRRRRTSASRWSSSLVTATTFQLAHCVEEADFPRAESSTTETSRLGGARGRVDGRLLPAQPLPDLGARRAQLPDRAPPLPALPHTLYPQIAEIVRRNAAKHGVRYTAQPSLCGRSARTSATCAGWAAGLPAEIEMG